MHFHLPKPLHGWRAFAGEVGIIVLGVLIALSAEQLVQQWHESAHDREAKQQMFLEMRDDNLPQAFARVAMAPCLDAELEAISRAADANASRAAVEQLVRQYEPPVRTWDSDAYDAAVSSGALRREGPQELIRWATIYQILPIMRAAGAEEGELIGDLTVLQDDRLPLTVDERSRIVRTTSRLQRANFNMSNVANVVIGLARSADIAMRSEQNSAILRELRAAYGSCVRDPATALTVNPSRQLSLPVQRRVALRTDHSGGHLQEGGRPSIH